MITTTRPSLVALERVSIQLRDGTRLLDDVTVDVRAGELVAIVGRSGAGKTTLLKTLAGVRTATGGRIAAARDDITLGYVPQDDIVHLDLEVEATLRYAARLRLPSGTPSTEVDAAVERTLALLGLTERRQLTVGALSGGQRKRVSIATELVVQPDVCFLDEPTSGLDPMAAASLLEALRALTDMGTAVVFSTHNLTDVRAADRLLVVAEGGKLAFDGDPAVGVAVLDAPRGSVPSVGEQASTPTRREVGTSTSTGGAPPAASVTSTRRRRARRPLLEQSRVLARRNVDLLLRNRMNLAIMAGSPLLVVAMFAILFPAHAFGATVDDSTAGIAIAYWLAFAGFFFGLTFGLLQICTELAIVRRERLVTIDVGPYLLAKTAVLAPALALVNVAMVGALVWLDRLPALAAGELGRLVGVLVLDSMAGLTLGLLASAAVGSTAQAALALPMLCFPAVLFSGAVLPVRSMTPVGRAIAAAVSDRWAFEAVGRSLALGHAGGHGDALSGAIGAHALVIVGLAVMCVLAAGFVLDHRTR